jgi:hypothetical protein
MQLSIRIYPFLFAFVCFITSSLVFAADLEAFLRKKSNAQVGQFFDRNAVGVASESTHTNNWAVLVGSSRYWFNYRVRIYELAAKHNANLP